MIWVEGEIIPDDALRLSARDRALEHGLGLFETLRTWNGHPTLLRQHLDRMSRSAHQLGLPLEPRQMPDSRAVSRLIASSGVSLDPGQDVRLRVTLSGGPATTPASGSVVWLSFGPLPSPIREGGAIISQTMQVTRDDPLARHKTLNYWRKRIALAHAIAEGSDDVLCLTTEGYICETTRANVFLVRGRRLLTPGPDDPMLPGVMRGVVLERAKRLGLEIAEGPLTVDQIATASEAFLTNSVRGIVPVARLLEAVLPADRPATRQLWGDILPWLESGGLVP